MNVAYGFIITIITVIVAVFSRIINCCKIDNVENIRGGKDVPILQPQILFSDVKSYKKYISGTSKSPSLHIGQRKLLLNEVQFLTELDPDEVLPLVVYAGAAPGNKTGYLSKLFPRVVFLLVDPNPFDIFGAKPVYLQNDPVAVVNTLLENNTNNRIFIINSYYTNELSIELKRARDKFTSIRFISDIRTEIEDIHIIWNNAQQYNWVRLLEPDAAMLKWRHIFYTTSDDELLKLSKEAPFADDFATSKSLGLDIISSAITKNARYFDGEIRLQPYAPLKSTETRLIIYKKADGSFPLRDYDDSSDNNYENIMFYFNTIDRGKPHFNDNVDLSIGFDYCNDCALENVIWKNYISRHVVKRDRGRKVIDYVKEVSKLTHRSLLKAPHGKLKIEFG